MSMVMLMLNRILALTINLDSRPFIGSAGRSEIRKRAARPCPVWEHQEL
jgi:hypothetical protein